MKTLFLATCYLVLTAVSTAASAAAQKADQNVVSVTFSIDGEQLTCPDLAVDLSLAGHPVVPKQTVDGFLVPALFNRKASAWPADEKVDAAIRCGQNAVKFSGLSPTWISWDMGSRYRLSNVLDRKIQGRSRPGTWDVDDLSCVRLQGLRPGRRNNRHPGEAAYVGRRPAGQRASWRRRE